MNKEPAITEEMMKEYTRARDQILESRDVKKFRKFIEENMWMFHEYARLAYEMHIDNDEWLKGVMAQTIMSTINNKSERTRRWAFEQLKKMGWDSDIKWKH